MARIAVAILAYRSLEALPTPFMRVPSPSFQYDGRVNALPSRRACPFAETKEQLGGYYLVKCESLDDAIEAAARIPSSRLGTIEVRPVMDVPDPGAP